MFSWQDNALPTLMDLFPLTFDVMYLSFTKAKIVVRNIRSNRETHSYEILLVRNIKGLMLLDFHLLFIVE